MENLLALVIAVAVDFIIAVAANVVSDCICEWRKRKK